MLKDVFGTPIQVGQVILISKGLRGHRDFQTGIVVNLSRKEGDEKAPVWIRTSNAYRDYNWQSKSFGNIFKLKESKHQATAEQKNLNIMVVANPLDLPEISEHLIQAAQLLIDNKIFPETYLLGQALSGSLQIKKGKKALPEIPDFEISLEMPESLKKE